MKTLILLLVLFISTIADAKTITLNGLTYGTEKSLVKGAWNGDEARGQLPTQEWLQSKMESKEHPLKWHSDLHPQLDLIWVINGPIDQVNKEVLAQQPTDRPATWFWSGASSSGLQTDVTIDLDAGGVGLLSLWQKGVKVGSCRCRSSEDTAKRPIGRHVVSEKNFGTHDGRPARLSQAATKKIGRPIYMYYTACIHETRGFFLHGGNQSSPTGGCIRIPFYADAEVWKLLQKGSQVNITQLG